MFFLALYIKGHPFRYRQRIHQQGRSTFGGSAAGQPSPGPPCLQKRQLLADLWSQAGKKLRTLRKIAGYSAVRARASGSLWFIFYAPLHAPLHAPPHAPPRSAGSISFGTGSTTIFFLFPYRYTQ
jgi:hypothetical protein